MNVELHARFFGRVQGVGFRFSTAQAAKHLGLTGTVKNLEDGSVELVAQGSQDKLDALLNEIQEVIFPGFVTKLEKRFTQIQQALPTFSIQ